MNYYLICIFYLILYISSLNIISAIQKSQIKATLLQSFIPHSQPVLIVPEIKKYDEEKFNIPKGNGSLALEFSRKFGDRGREARNLADEKAKVMKPAPPGQAEELMLIVDEMVTKVSMNGGKTVMFLIIYC